MTLPLYMCLGLAVLVLLLGLVWRAGSRRTSLPCPDWLAWLVELDNPLAKSNNARTIVSRLDLHSGMRVLDVGCGPGRLTIPVAQEVSPQGEVVAIDIQPGMLRRAREKAQEAGLTNIQFIQLSVGEGNLTIDQFDRVLLVTVLGEIPDRQNALKEIYAALKPSGLLSITAIIFDPHYQSHRAIIRLAGPAGFREKDFFGNRLAFTVNLVKHQNG